MSKLRIHRPSPALVVASLALLVALGGTGYATVLQVPRNSVGTLQLKRNAVTSSKLAPNTVRTGQIVNGSLLGVDFKAGQIPQGPKGDKGDKGDKGAKGDNGLSRVFQTQTAGPSFALPASFTPIVSLQLQAGRYLILGKILLSGSQPNFTGICTTGVGSTVDVGLAAAYGGTVPGNVVDTVSMHTIVDLSAAGTATISCRTPRTGFYDTATLTAIQVG